MKRKLRWVLSGLASTFLLTWLRKASTPAGARVGGPASELSQARTASVSMTTQTIPRVIPGSDFKANDSETSPRKTWHDGIDRMGKTLLTLAGVLFALGMILDNVQLHIIGIHDPSVFQSRFVLAGVAFIVYLALPALPLVTPILVWRWIRKRAKRGRSLAAVIAAMIALLLCILFLFEPFEPFIGQFETASSFLEKVLIFWKPFFDPWGWVRGPPLYLPMILLAATAGSGSQLDTSKWRIRFCWLIVVGAFSSIFPYGLEVYPNLSRAAGGGCPLIAQIELTLQR